MTLTLSLLALNPSSCNGVSAVDDTIRGFEIVFNTIMLCLHGNGCRRIQIDPFRKLDRIGLMYTRDRCGTGPERIRTDPKLDLLFHRFNLGSIWIRSGPVPERSPYHTTTIPYPIFQRELSLKHMHVCGNAVDRSRSGPVP